MFSVYIEKWEKILKKKKTIAFRVLEVLEGRQRVGVPLAVLAVLLSERLEVLLEVRWWLEQIEKFGQKVTEVFVTPLRKHNLSY